MDDVDLKILEILRQDSRTKFVKIAEVVGLTEGAVRKRVKKMMDEGAIIRFTIETKAEVEGIVLVKTDPALTRQAAQKIKKFSDKVFEVSGDYDIAALIQAYTIEELNRRVDEIRGLAEVLNTNTLIKLVSD
jgi:DNA-binding Lrp family transcriptional regulator